MNNLSIHCRNFLKTACLAAVAICAGLSVSALATAKQKPNIVFVLTDDQGYGDLSCHGHPVLKTPNIDVLHAESIRLTDYHVSPTCSPTRGALMSGHFTNRAGPWHTIMGRSMLYEGEHTFGSVFSAQGYATGLFGNLNNRHQFPRKKGRPKDLNPGVCGEFPGKALNIKTAGSKIGGSKIGGSKIGDSKIGDIEQEKPVIGQSQEVSFEVKLKKGEVNFLEYFILADGTKMGSYYAYVDKM